MKLWRGQPDHNHWKTPFTPKERALAQLGIGACFCLLALSDWISPKQPPFTGKWGWLYSWAHSNFGEFGAVWLELGIAMLLFALAGLSWLQRGKATRNLAQ